MLDSNATRRSSRVADAAHVRFEESKDLDELFTTDYRWGHTQRVCQYGHRLAEGEGRTRLRLINHGYGEGEFWDPVYEYFDKAWGLVMENLTESLGEESR